MVLPNTVGYFDYRDCVEKYTEFLLDYRDCRDKYTDFLLVGMNAYNVSDESRSRRSQRIYNRVSQLRAIPEINGYAPAFLFAVSALYCWHIYGGRCTDAFQQTDGVWPAQG
jgi:hypothetical protein